MELLILATGNQDGYHTADDEQLETSSISSHDSDYEDTVHGYARGDTPSSPLHWLLDDIGEVNVRENASGDKIDN